MEKNWYRERINLGRSCGTLDIMEWIRDNKCPDLEHTIFAGNLDELMVSRCSVDSSLVELIDEGLDEWFEYEGMKRHGNPQYGWYFVINDEWYYCSIY